MPMARGSAARRVLALMLLLSFTLFGFEAVAVDSHYADSGTAHAAGFADHTSGHAVPSQSPGPTQGQDDHSLHVCHCSHAHGGLVLTTPSVTTAVVQACSEEFQLPPAVASLRVSPPVRPPIA